jgi:hypothetical protein
MRDQPFTTPLMAIVCRNPIWRTFSPECLSRIYQLSVCLQWPLYLTRRCRHSIPLSHFTFSPETYSIFSDFNTLAAVALISLLSGIIDASYPCSTSRGHRAKHTNAPRSLPSYIRHTLPSSFKIVLTLPTCHPPVDHCQ